VFSGDEFEVLGKGEVVAPRQYHAHYYPRQGESGGDKPDNQPAECGYRDDYDYDYIQPTHNLFTQLFGPFVGGLYRPLYQLDEIPFFELGQRGGGGAAGRGDFFT